MLMKIYQCGYIVKRKLMMISFQKKYIIKFVINIITYNL